MKNRLIQHDVTISTGIAELLDCITIFQESESADTKLIFITPKDFIDLHKFISKTDVTDKFTTIDMYELDKINLLFTNEIDTFNKVLDFLFKLKNYQYNVNDDNRYEYIVIFYNIDVNELNNACNELSSLNNEARIPGFHITYAYDDEETFKAMNETLSSSIIGNTPSSLIGHPIEGYFKI
jgi:hypothetical protein